MTEPTTAEICARFRGMYVPAVSDAMYELGMPEPVLPTALRPLFPEQSFVGIAFTVEGVEIVPAVSWDEGKVTDRVVPRGVREAHPGLGDGVEEHGQSGRSLR